MCSCGDSNDCLSDGVHHFDCNCDSNLPTFTNDEGFITAKDLLPITNVFYGPLLYDSQNASFTIGKLRCKGNFEYENMLCIDAQRNLFPRETDFLKYIHTFENVLIKTECFRSIC